MVLHKHDFILKMCKGKNVLHVGATDYPYHEIKAKDKKLLHQKLKLVAKNLIGLDFDKDSILKLKQYGINDIYFGDIIKNKYDKEIISNKYDIIVFGDVIEHLDSPGLALENLKQFCNKETKLLLTTPNVWTIFNLSNHFRKNEEVHQDHTFWPSKKTMDRLIMNSGYKIEKFLYLMYNSNKDKITFKGRIFKNTILTKFQFMNPTLGYVLSYN